MLRVLLILMLLASWPGQAARGAVPGTPPSPASPQNRAPQAVGYIDVGPLNVGGSSETVSASSYFSDPDNDTLTYSVNSPSPSIATVSISGSTVTIAPVAVGTTGKIVVTARDPGGLTATQDFNVTVQNPPPPKPPNRAPTTVGSISNVSLQVGGSSATRNVSGNFSDPDNDTLTYSVNSPSSSIATVSISGSTVTVTPVAAGTTGKIVVTARDPGGLTATQDFTATVAAAPPPPPPPPPKNRAPTAVGYISNVSLQVGGSSATRSVSGNFSDPDNDTLTYSVNSPNPSIVSVSISGSTVTVAPVAAGTTGKIVVTARDPGGLTATQDFTATVENPPPPPPPKNKAPQTKGSIGDQTLNKGGDTRTINVSSYFTDPNGDTLTYSVNSPSPSIVTTSISGSTLTLTSVAVGNSAKVIVTARDPGGLTATQDFTVAVINRKPTKVGSISNKTLNKGGVSTTVTASSYFTDPDGDALTYSASSSKTSVATASISGSTVTVTSKATGTTTITVTATDTGSLSATQTFSVTVVNRKPTKVGSISAKTLNKGGASTTVTASSYFTDPDGDALTYSASSSKTSVATASVSGSTVTVTSVAAGTATITVTATDPDNLSATQTFSVTVVNRKPTKVGSISGQNLNVGASATVTASSYFTDPDGDALTYSASSSSASVATASASGSTVTVTAKAAGSATVTVTASDGSLSATQTFSVNVTAPPRPPPPPPTNQAPATRGSIGPKTLNKVGASTTVTASSYFTDPDGDALTYSASSSSASVATVSVSGSTVTVTAQAAGTTNITVTATDTGSLSAKQTFSVTVTTAPTPPLTPTPPTPPPTKNRSPETKGSISRQPLARNGVSITVNAASRFSDPDGDTLSYASASSDTSVATASISGSIVTLAPVANGAATITVTATDPGKLSATQTFTATVSHRPAKVGSIPTQDMAANVNSRQVNVSSYFSDADKDTLVYTASTSKPSPATVSVSGDTVTIRRVSAGTGSVFVKATDPGGLSAIQTIAINLANRKPVVGKKIPNQTLHVTDAFRTVSLDSSFTDPDGKALAFTAKSSNSSVATATAGGTTLTIRPVAYGEATITVRATDHGGRYVEQTLTATVKNRAPEPVGTGIGLQHLYMSSGARTIDVAPYFSDPDGDRLSYSSSWSDSAIVGVSTLGSVVTLTPRKPGNTGKINVTATDPKKATGSQDFNVTVKAGSAPPDTSTNRQPVAVNPIVPDTLYQFGPAATIDLTPVFSDSGDVLTYTAYCPDPDKALVSVSGSNLKITPKGPGTTGKSTVTARDRGGLTATQDFNITVKAGYPPKPPNSPPVTAAPITPDSLYQSGPAATIDLTKHFRDPDDDTLTYAAILTDTTVVKVSVSGSTLTITPTGVGTTGKIVVTATDPDSAQATHDFQVTVLAGSPPVKVNRPPEKSTSVDHDLYVTIGGGTKTFSAVPYFTDPDGDTLTYKLLHAPGSGRATVTLSGSTLSVEPLALGSTGKHQLRATDPGGLFAEQDLTFHVVRNLAPVTPKTFSAQTLTLCDGSETFKLSSYFSDPDNDVLTYTVSSSDSTAATASESGGTLTVTPKKKELATTVTVTATDTGNLSVTQSFQVTVVNSAPDSVGTMPAQTLTLCTGSVKFGLTTYFRDCDGDSLTYAVSSSDTTAATASVSGDSLKVTPKKKNLTATVTVTATDTGNLSASHAFQVPVGNSAPDSVGTMPDRSLTLRTGSVKFGLTTYFRDCDGDSLAYTAASSDTNAATTSVSGDSLTVTPKKKGLTTKVTVTATDTENLSASHSFRVTVGNSAPDTDGTIPDQRLTLRTGSVKFDLTTYFTDADGDTLEYKTTSPKAAVATVRASGDSLYIKPVSVGTIDSVTVTATDPGGLSATQTFTVTVDNSAPDTVGTMPDRTLPLSAGLVKFDLTTYFTDADGDTLEYTTTSPKAAVATVRASDDSLYITPVAAGTIDSVTVTATDPGGLSATQTFTVTVDNSAPDTVGTMPDRTLPLSAGLVKFDLTTYFTDADGDTLEYTTTSPKAAVATVRASDDSLYITPVAAGTIDTVTVTATDTEDLSAKQHFAVTVTGVANRCPATTGAIPKANLTVGGDSLTVAVAGFFSDADADVLTYTVDDPDATVAKVSIAGSTVKIKPVAAGKIDTVTVTASDGTCSASQTFGIEVSAPAGPDPRSGPWSASGGNVYRLTGNVGIGTSKPDQRLVVDGAVTAEAVRVDSVSSADYVFDPDYPLMPLEELERFLRTNGHLPGIASAEQMEASGLRAGEMQTRLLAKIEELTLYVIAQHERLASQRRLIDQYRRRLVTRQQRVEALERRLERLERSR